MTTGHRLFGKIPLYALIFLFCSCQAYKQNVMFQVPKNGEMNGIKPILAQAEKNYTIEVNDYLDISVYSNGGELIIDPNRELQKEIGNSSGSGFSKPIYLVQSDGAVNLPLVGKVPLAGLTINSADSALEAVYSQYYESPYVYLKLQNRRAIVLGPLGGRVIPLENENMNIIEVIALYGGVDINSKAHNIRLIRGDLNDPQVEVIDLSTIAGLKKASVHVQSEDIIYIEPVRKVLTESIRDISPIIGLFTSVITLIIVFTR